MKVYVLVGAPGSGKSTYTKELLKKHSGNAVILSSDYFRVKMFGSRKVGNEAHNSTRVFEEMHRNLKNLLGWNQYEAVIYDATNLSRNRRRALYNNVKTWSKGDAEIEIIYFSMPLSRLIKNNSKRSIEEFVPEHLIKQMYINQQVPRTGSDCDSFKVVSERMFNEDMNVDSHEQWAYNNFAEYVLSSISGFDTIEFENILSDHDCAPHHMESIAGHIQMCILNVYIRQFSQDYRKDMNRIAMFHDLGKSITKTMVDKNGVEKATYRGHAGVSANYMLNYFFNKNGGIISPKEMDLVEVVYQHMNAHQGITQKNINKNKLNDNVLKMLEDFRIIDSISRVKGDETVGV